MLYPSHFFKSYEKYFLCILLSSLFLFFASFDVKQPYLHANQHLACLPKLAPMARLISILAVSAMQYMKMFRYRSDGLGGHFGLSCSPRLGVEKRVTKHYVLIILYKMILQIHLNLLSVLPTFTCNMPSTIGVQSFSI